MTQNEQGATTRSATEGVIYTIGHSSHSLETFIQYLRKHGITAVVDVRFSPYSRYNPQFNRETLAAALARAGIAYLFLGEELGGRSRDASCYENGRVVYSRLAARAEFRRGIDRLLEGSQQDRLALMCAEKEPLECHRTILICRHLHERGVPIRHILGDGSLEDHGQTEERLLKITGVEPTLFDYGEGRASMLERAYERQARRIAYKREQGERAHEPA